MWRARVCVCVVASQHNQMQGRRGRGRDETSGLTVSTARAPRRPAKSRTRKTAAEHRSRSSRDAEVSRAAAENQRRDEEDKEELEWRRRRKRPCEEDEEEEHGAGHARRAARETTRKPRVLQQLAVHPTRRKRAGKCQRTPRSDKNAESSQQNQTVRLYLL